MPFFGKFSCFSFTHSSVRQNAPQRSGVYAISNANEWIFVGSTNDLQAALHKHLMEVGTPLKTKAPTGFTFQACDLALRQGFLDELVAELRPSCNLAADSQSVSSSIDGE
jgi:hypothetical protein